MKRHLGCALVLALTCAACGGGGENAESTTTSDQTPSTSGTSSSSSTSSTLFIFNEDPPPLENTGEDFEQILTSLIGYSAWLVSHPDPDQADIVYEPGTSVFETAQDVLRTERDDELTTVVSAVEFPKDVRVTDRPGDDVVLLFATTPDLGYTTTNADGEVVDEDAPGPDRSFIFELRRNGGQWRIAAITELGEVR